MRPQLQPAPLFPAQLEQVRGVQMHGTAVASDAGLLNRRERGRRAILPPVNPLVIELAVIAHGAG